MLFEELPSNFCSRQFIDKFVTFSNFVTFITGHFNNFRVLNKNSIKEERYLKIINCGVRYCHLSVSSKPDKFQVSIGKD